MQKLKDWLKLGKRVDIFDKNSGNWLNAGVIRQITISLDEPLELMVGDLEVLWKSPARSFTYFNRVWRGDFGDLTIYSIRPFSSSPQTERKREKVRVELREDEQRRESQRHRQFWRDEIERKELESARRYEGR